jgi:hypothetical protein
LGLSRSGLTPFGTTFTEMAGFAEPRAFKPPAMKDMLAELRQSRDDWNAQAEIRRLWRRINAKLEGKRQSMSAQWRGCNPETLRFTALDLSILTSRKTSKLSRWP